MSTIANRHIEVGSVLPNGATVIACVQEKAHDRYLVLCVWSASEFKYVCWYVSPFGDAYWGNYFQELQSALDDFTQRKRG